MTNPKPRIQPGARGYGKAASVFWRVGEEVLGHMRSTSTDKYHLEITAIEGMICLENVCMCLIAAIQIYLVSEKAWGINIALIATVTN